MWTQQNLRLIRIYSFLSLGAAVIVTAAELIRVVIHFAFKVWFIVLLRIPYENDVNLRLRRVNLLMSVSLCLPARPSLQYVTKFIYDYFFVLIYFVEVWYLGTYEFHNTISWGCFRLYVPQLDSLCDIHLCLCSVCNNAWSRDSFSEIAWFIVAAVFGFLFSSIAFAYYRQLLDPTSAANQARAPSAQARAAGVYPTHYNPPYASGGRGYAPPPGPPPPAAASSVYVPEYDPAKLPDYGEDDATVVDGLGGFDKKGADPFADFDRRSDSEHGRDDGARNVW